MSLVAVSASPPGGAPDPAAVAASVLIVDDRAVARSLLTEFAHAIAPGVRVESFADPLAALDRALADTPDLIITDYRMPGMDGIAFTRRVRAVPRLWDVPIVMVTVVEDRDVHQQAVEAGANDFLIRPFDQVAARLRCRNLLTLRRLQQATTERARWFEEQVTQAAMEIHRREREALLLLARAGEYRDQGTGQHVLRTSRYARLIAEALQLSPQQCDEIECGAALHDIGKIGIPDAILHKPGPLTEAEMARMRAHPTLGHALLSVSASPYLQAAAAIALGHHERFDGTGYPQGLAGDAIPLSARIVAVADVFEVLTSARPYREAWPVEQALEYLREQSGRQFDPDCVQAFLQRLNAVTEVLRDCNDAPACAR